MCEIDTSIVLATCSRASMLRGALSSLLAEAATWSKPLEIVIVDDGSTDDTADVLLEFQRTSAIPFTIVSGHCQGVAAARNLAAENARGTWLASFDDDQIALQGWLAALRNIADDTGSACVGGTLQLDLPSGHSSSELGARVRQVLGETVRSAHSAAYRPASNNVLIRRDVFDQLGGYDRSFTEGAEDVDLFDRVVLAGHSLAFAPRAKALHVTPESRLKPENIRWTATRIGASEARRFVRRGKRKLLSVAITRVIALLLRDIPQYGWAAITGDRKMKLNVLCSVCYTRGLLRLVPAFLTGRLRESEFLRSMDFRARNGERSDFTTKMS